MALIFCPECNNKVSSLAASCPKCGCPISNQNQDVNEAIDRTVEERYSFYTNEIVEDNKVTISNSFLNEVKSQDYDMLSREGPISNREIDYVNDFEDENVPVTENNILKTSEASAEQLGTEIKEVVSANIGTFVPVFELNMVSKLDREQTMKLLLEVGDIAKESEGYNKEVSKLLKKKAEEEEETEAIRKRLSTTAILIIVGGTLACFLLGLFGGALCIVTGIIGYILLKRIVSYFDLQKHSEENNALAEEYYNSHVVPIEKKLEEVYALIEAFANSGKKEWAVDVVGEKLFYSECVKDLYELVKNRRADSLKEALNRYDDDHYKARMEEMQAKIEAASIIAAEESKKQSVQMEQANKNLRQIKYDTHKIKKKVYK